VVSLRLALASDRPFLKLMLAAAFDWRGDATPELLETITSRPDIAHYIEGWPRQGEVGLVAEDGDEAVGAAWWRFFTDADPGYGYVDERTPELSIGVVPAHRRRGVGTLLLGGLIDEARRRGLPALSLSVESGNGAIGLYRTAGFETVGRVGNADTMVHHLGP
jgi:ribosomal protein S18 acetylase RimI-like enzyme